MPSPSRLVELLESLVPQNEEDLSLLQQLLACALHLQKKAFLSFGKNAMSEDLRALVAAIPESASKYFHGLVEALDVYESIHGTAIAPQSLSARDESLQELKQIRDMCLDENRRAIYW